MRLGRFGRIAAQRGGLLLGALALTAPAALALQTTANLEVAKDATIRGGSYASTRHGGDDLLVTRSSDNDTYVRRAVLTFDTATTMPSSSRIQSATLVLTVRGGNSETRELTAHGVPISFDQDDVTWNQRKSGINWSNPGADVTGTPVKALVRSTPGSQVTFNVTTHVQKVVNGDFGSRYARFLISDPGNSSRDSYKEFHASESTDRARRPRLIVAYGAEGTAPVSSSGAVQPDGAGNLTMTADAVTIRQGRWTVESSTTAPSGTVVRHADGGMGKISQALASPTHYFEMTFTAEAGRPYRLWLLGRADGDDWDNDSVHVQFSGSVTQSGSSTYRIGSTSAAALNLEDCSGCGLSGWMWQDNGWGSRTALGPEIYFASSGLQTIRVQTREDGLAIDQILLSPSTYLDSAPADPAGDSTPDPITTPATDVLLSPASKATRHGKWVVDSDGSAAGGQVVRHPNANASKISQAYSSPSNYFDMMFEARADTPYRIWIHGRAENDSWSNDSVHVQFSGSVTSGGSATARIGSTSSVVVNLEDCDNCGLSGWAWQDNGWGSRTALGPEIYFATSGTQTIRVQTREDGLSIDQIMLSPAGYLGQPPPETSTPEPAPAPEPEPAPSTSGVKLRVLMWNIHHGVGTDGDYDINRLATWMANMTPDVIMLNEVEKYTGWGNEDQPARFKSLLEQKTGRRWYAHFAQEFGNWSSSGKGHLILSKYAFDDTGYAEITPSDGLKGAGAISQARITVNGRTLNFLLTHLDPYSQSMRLIQARDAISWASSFAENRILGGDMNAWPDQSSIAEINKTYKDSWTEAVRIGEATAVSGVSPFGATKNGRIDYIFFSENAPHLVVLSSKVYDTRNSSGVMPSDHRPVLTTFLVK